MLMIDDPIDKEIKKGPMTIVSNTMAKVLKMSCSDWRTNRSQLFEYMCSGGQSATRGISAGDDLSTD